MAAVHLIKTLLTDNREVETFCGKRGTPLPDLTAVYETSEGPRFQAIESDTNETGICSLCRARKA